MFQTKVVEKIKTHISCSIIFFDNRAVCEIMWKNIVEPDRPQMTNWRMRIACRMTKAKNTHTEHVHTYYFFTVTMVARMQLSVTLCVYFYFMIRPVDLLGARWSQLCV